ncbi:MAG: hypothetical protein LUH00_01035 [Lachnospiraceae bacterium]|nr:hypothetical protein [Lachnospiraceae bacterium]
MPYRRNVSISAKQEISFTEGPIFGSLIRFAEPVLGALILQAAYGAVDLLVVGQFGDAASISAVGTTIILFAVIGIILTVALEASANLIVRILQVPESATEKAVLYLRICSEGLLVIITYNVISGILRGIGNANLPWLRKQYARHAPGHLRRLVSFYGISRGHTIYTTASTKILSPMTISFTPICFFLLKLKLSIYPFFK